MTPRTAQKIAHILQATAIMLALIATTLAIKLAVDWFYPTKPTDLLAQLPPEPPRYHQSLPESRLTNAAFRQCWEAEITAPAPSSQPQAKPPQPRPEPKQVSAQQLPFSWVSAIVHSQPSKSYVVLFDQVRQHQLLLQQGQAIPGSNYRVLKIGRDEIEISCGPTAIAIIERPKPWQQLGKLPKQQQNLVRYKTMLDAFGTKTSDRAGRIMVTDTSVLGQYGFHQHDQIIAVGGERVQNLPQLKQRLANAGHVLTEISVLRRGRMISLYIPGDKQ